MSPITTTGHKVKCPRCESTRVTERKTKPVSTAERPAKLGPGYFRMERTCHKCGFVWEKKQ